MSRRAEFIAVCLVTLAVSFTAVLIYTEAADRVALVQQEGE